MNEKFEIRKASVMDIPVIREMAAVVFPDTYRDILSPDQIDYMMNWMYSEESLHKQMAEDGHMYYIAYCGEEAVGYLSIQPEEEGVYHLQKLYVMGSCRGKRLGRQLFEYAIMSIKERHPANCQMRLNVNRENKALTFYEKMGMTKVEEGDFPIGNGYYMNDYIMGMEI
ncbi:MAG: GNAT family N-acetyltransferase [Bacteroidaceae bacterium]|nr:GNAT family N-acetyltransferase [Bacteroidaceae bacterium]